MHDSYATKTLEKALEGLRQNLLWEQKLLEGAEIEVANATRKVEEISEKINEVVKDLSFLRSY